MSSLPVLVCVLLPEGRRFTTLRMFDASHSVLKAIELVEQWLKRQPHRLYITKIDDIDQTPIDPRKSTFNDMQVSCDITHAAVREAIVTVHSIEPTEITPKWYEEPRVLFVACSRNPNSSNAVKTRDGPLTRRSTRVTR